MTVCVYVCMCVCVFVHNHWAPGKVAFKLKAATVKVRILYPLSHTVLNFFAASKTHLVLNNYNGLIATSLYRMYTQRQSLLYIATNITH